MKIDIFKKFDGKYNYFNCTGLNGKILYRRQKKYKYKGQLLVSEIVDQDDNVILESYETEAEIISYEDPRFINENEISVCKCIIDKFNPLLVINVKFIVYNLNTKEIKRFKTQNKHFEKHWQFHDDIIIYHIHPFTLMDCEENVVKKQYFDFSNWINLYGEPRLSTNIFEVCNIKYLLFHSCILKENSYLKYYIGLLRLNDDLSPFGYYMNPFIDCENECTTTDVLMSMRKWRDDTKYYKSVYYDVIFPMNVVVNDDINVYCGINDCSAGYIQYTIDEFLKKIKNEPFILL